MGKRSLLLYQDDPIMGKRSSYLSQVVFFKSILCYNRLIMKIDDKGGIQVSDDRQRLSFYTRDPLLKEWANQQESLSQSLRFVLGWWIQQYGTEDVYVLLQKELIQSRVKPEVQKHEVQPSFQKQSEVNSPKHEVEEQNETHTQDIQLRFEPEDESEKNTPNGSDDKIEEPDADDHDFSDMMMSAYYKEQSEK